MEVASPAFQANAPIPYEYTCDGEDVSPPFFLKDVPKGAVSLVIIVEDPDTSKGTFDHWLAWNIPPETISIKKGYSPPIEGLNGSHEIRYKGPCPPPGKVHRYFFKVYAIDTMISLSKGSSKNQLLEAIKGHILGEAELVGTYKK